MTREEAKTRMKRIYNDFDGTLDDTQAISMAIQALSQEPCDDAVSRQDALNCLTGKWIKMFRTDTGDIDSQCSECGFIHKFIDGHTAQYNYCPNCSAKMESEDKE